MLDLSNRSNCFYWQTDRDLTPEDYAEIFLKRHEISDADIVSVLNQGITSISEQKSIVVVPTDENVIKGNVNIVRKVLINAKPYVVRLHPRGVKNGYFFVEQAALNAAKEHGIPVPEILEVHQAQDEKDMDFVLMTQSSGKTMDNYLKQDNTQEDALLLECGKTMAKLHDIVVEGFGSFDNEYAKKTGKLKGLHNTYRSFILTGLDENLERLVKFSIIDVAQSKKFRQVFDEHNYEPIDTPRIVHNDFADWNLLTDGKQITAVLDWDECHAGDPVADLACWSTFFLLERYEKFLKGYTSVKQLPADYEERFHYYRLRYTISKMALRIKRFQVDQSPDLLKRIEVGTKALAEELSWFKL